MPTISLVGCLMAMIRWSASAANRFPAASGNGSALRRALLIDPRLLILDEATSSVDTDTEREIQSALENLTRGRTTIVIAHRLSTLGRADRLVMIERGRVTEVGPHSQLLKQEGTYARMYRAQFEMAGENGDQADPASVQIDKHDDFRLEWRSESA